MGWRELMGWRREYVRSLKARRESQTTGAESWSHGRDEWWAQADAKRQRERGRG